MLRLTRSQFVRMGLSAPLFYALGAQTRADDTRPPMGEANWQPLTDDPSRAELFEKLVIPFGRKEYPDDDAVTLAIPPVFTFPDDVRTDRIENKPRQNAIFGIDISHHLPHKMDFSSLKLHRVDFIYCKATQGIGYKDGKFGEFWKELGKLSANNNIPRGAYHFLSSDSPGKDQADRFLDYVRLQGDFQPGDLPPVLDLEWDVTPGNPDRWRGRGKQYILDQTLGCLDRIQQRTGKTPIVYTAKAWFGAETLPLSEFSKLSAYPLWIADYNNKRKLSEKPDVPGGAKPLIWQFTDRAKLAAGFDGGLDASVFYGTEQEFRKAFGLS
jgi:lysozyme